MCNTHGLLTPSRPSLLYARPGSLLQDVKCAKGKTFLLTVCHHGNEPCGLIAFNQLVKEGFLDRRDEGEPWPWPWDILRVELANPRALEAGKRFLDVNLNRIYTERDIAEAASPQCTSYEHTLIGRLLMAIRDCDEFLDVHSTSATTPPFAFHMGSLEAASYAASFPVAYTLEDSSEGSRGTGVAYAALVGVQRAVVVECGQHDDPRSVEVAKGVIRRFLTGHRVGPDDLVGGRPPVPLRIEDGAYVRKGFRWAMPRVEAFQRVEHGQLIAVDEEEGELLCPFPEGALLVMPTQLPVVGEEAWLWGHPLPQ
eukprot:jgi/Botrbrau1/11638/Bobra.0209s0028.1